MTLRGGGRAPGAVGAPRRGPVAGPAELSWWAGGAGAGWACSYAAVGAACGVGALLPGAAATVLGPVLLVGLVGLGVTHGACDQLVLPAHRRGPKPGRGYLLQFGVGYVALAVGAALVWWQWPAVAVALFFGLTGWHWGSADAPAHPRRGVWVAHSLLRGALLFAVPLAAWPTETARGVDGLLALTGALPVAAGSWAGPTVALGSLVLVGHGALWAYFARRHTPGRWRRDAAEVALLGALFTALPPLLALGVYFVFWHSLQHVLRLTPLLGYAPGPARTWPALAQELTFFVRRAWPMLLASLAVGAGAYVLGRAWLPAHDAWLGLAVLAASVLTLPHALLVSLIMDAPKWRARAAGGRAAGA